MKPSYLSLLRLGSILLIAACGNAAGEDKPAIVLSPELALNAPDVPDEKNGIVLFERRVEKLDQATFRSLNEAVELLRAGTAVNNPALFEELARLHLVARETLKPPARFPRRTEFNNTLPYLQTFKGADALASRSALEGDRAAAMTYRRDMLEWSRLMRTSHPELLSYLFGIIGWRDAFNGMLRDWESHPDQKAGLAEIERCFREFPCPSSELVPVNLREAQFWCDIGGTRGALLKLPRDQSAASLLREPFDKVTIGDLLELPYDEADEIRRKETDLLGVIAAIRRNAPFAEWPGILPEEPAGENIDAYRNIPNGLGELLEDYSHDYYKGAMAVILFQQPAMETCLAWLKAEGEGVAFTGNSPGVKPDPMTGKPLKIEPESRRIRSAGPDLELEEVVDADLLPGLAVSESDCLVKVPSWRKDDD